MKTAIIFPGQGSQMVGMGKDLNENFSIAKDVFAEVDNVLKYNLSNIMFDGSIDELSQTQNTQPALMAVSIALIRILQKELDKNFDELCEVTAGHSLGEYSALCSANSFSLEQTAHLLKIRGNAMAKCAKKTQGAMAAILGLDIDIAKEIVKKAAQDQICHLANDNSNSQIVISGQKEAIDRAMILAKEHGAKRAIMLPVSGAFHSPLMFDAQEEMAQALSDMGIKDPIVPIIANVTANKVTDSNLIPDLLVRQVTGSVRWRETLLFMQNNNIERLIEIGSGKVLCGLAAKTCPDIATISIQNYNDLKDFISSYR